MAKKYIKKYSSSLAWEKGKLTQCGGFIPPQPEWLRSQNNWQPVDMEKEEHLLTAHLFMGKKIGVATMNVSEENPLNAENKATTDPAIPLLSMCPKDSKSYSTDPCPVMAIAALCTMARRWKQQMNG